MRAEYGDSLIKTAIIMFKIILFIAILSTLTVPNKSAASSIDFAKKTSWLDGKKAKTTKSSQETSATENPKENGNKETSKEKKKIDIQAKITSVTSASREARGHGYLGTFMIEWFTSIGKKDHALITVTKETLIFKQIGQVKQKASFKSLEKGLRVSIRVTGPWLLSNPKQAKAEEILIIEQTIEERK